MRRLALLSLLLAGCAVGAEGDAKPAPPVLKGDQPAIGRKLELELTTTTGKIALAGVPGRVTVICVVEEANGLAPCTAALARYADRVSVAGLWIKDEPLPVTDVPYRVFSDPGGKKLLEKLELKGPHVIVVDRQGRIRMLLMNGDNDATVRAVGDLDG
jgi:hypothetical protein